MKEFSILRELMDGAVTGGSRIFNVPADGKCWVYSIFLSQKIDESFVPLDFRSNVGEPQAILEK